MHLSSVKRTNLTFEDENPTARGKKQVADTPRRALGDVKNMLRIEDQRSLDINDDIVEESNLHEDPRIEATLFQREDSVILSDPGNDAEYFEKLISTAHYGNDSITDDDDETIEMCGLEDEPFDYRHVLNNVDGNAVLTDDFPPFLYEKPDPVGLDKVKNYTLQEIEELFDSFSDVLIL
uniref:Protein LTV1 homolog n=1 Tax=Angiostrongylus cantonensis TaxID=6313 RepID=A0A0K0DA64_ANGCA